MVLIESTSDSTKYININEHCIVHRDGTENCDDCDLITVDRNQLIASLNETLVDGNEAYKSLHERVKRYLLADGRTDRVANVVLINFSISRSSSILSRKVRSESIRCRKTRRGPDDDDPSVLAGSPRRCR